MEEIDEIVEDTETEITRYPHLVTLQVQLGQVMTVVDVPVLAQNEAEAVVFAGTNIQSFIKLIPMRVIRTAQ